MPDNWRYRLKTTIFLLCLAALYCWPVWWNHWPIIFNDTASYLDTARVGTIYSYQSPGYGLFLRVCLLVWHSPYAIVLAQAIIMVASLWMVARALNVSYRRGLLLIALFGVITPLPLVASIILPDSIFFSGFLSLLALIINPESRHRSFLLTVTVLATATHIATGLLFLFILLISGRLLTRIRPQNQITRHTRILTIELLLFFAASQVILLLLFPHKPVSILPIHVTAQLIDDNGPAITELKENCASENYSLCPYLQEITGVNSDYFLWNESQPFRQHFGQWSYTPADWPRLIWRTVSRHPQETLNWLLRRWQYQFFTYRIGYEYAHIGWDANVPDSLRQSFGDSAVASWQHSRQEADWFSPMPQPWPIAYDLTALLAHLSPLLLWLWWRRDARRPLALVVLLAVLINALIMGTASHPQNRYQLRIHYAPLVLLVFAWGASRTSTPPSTPLPSDRYKSSKYR